MDTPRTDEIFLSLKMFITTSVALFAVFTTFIVAVFVSQRTYLNRSLDKQRESLVREQEMQKHYYDKRLDRMSLDIDLMQQVLMEKESEEQLLEDLDSISPGVLGP